MSETIRGKAFVLGENIDTDQIIPAEHLVYSLDDPSEKKYYGRFALSGVPVANSGLPDGGVAFTGENSYESQFAIIIGGRNFGCGSSREHAPAALQIAGARAVVAPSYARIFYRNAVDGGFLVPFETEEDLTKAIRTFDELEISREQSELCNLTSGKSHALKPLGDVADIVQAGGIFAYARQKGMMS